MGRTLNLCEHLLDQANHCQAIGVDDRALRIFGDLARLRDLPKDIAEESQFRTAVLLIKQGEFAQARRHLAAALAHDDNNAEYHYLMACAHHHDVQGNRRQAMTHYRACLRLDPENAIYHCDAGLFAVKEGATEEGLQWLRRAAELAPDDPEVIGDVAECLQEQWQGHEARTITRAALFRNNKDARFRQVWNHVRFQELHRRQERERQPMLPPATVPERPAALSFLRLTVETPNGRKLVRRDGASGIPPSHLRLQGARSGPKHA